MSIFIILLSGLITLGAGLANHVDKGVKPEIDYDSESVCGQADTNPCQIYIR